ncbi:MAG: Carnitine transport permease protein OpuCB [Anaerolineae bacterium]|nr:Carnitine transport permease protein OpuCB [Anaerolineae bacterium]RIK33381.1 MAG: glycine/betaine ABC transporter [Chloroflexota bacterium]
MILLDAFQYALAHTDEWLGALEQHLLLVAVALTIGIGVCVPLGALTARSRAASLSAINAANGLRVIPSLAILFLALPYFGLSFTAAALALTLLALPPILINTDAAFRGIAPAIQEAARGMGMNSRQMLWRVEFPLALPVILAGIRIATVEVIASATLAAFIGAGGLGIYITRGFALYDNSILLVGAISVALLALSAEIILGALERLTRAPH